MFLDISYFLYELLNMFLIWLVYLHLFFQPCRCQGCISRKPCRDPGSNRGPSDLQSDALPAELSRRCLTSRSLLIPLVRNAFALSVCVWCGVWAQHVFSKCAVAIVGGHSETTAPGFFRPSKLGGACRAQGPVSNGHSNGCGERFPKSVFGALCLL